jgi:hypothetical protein
MASLGWKGLSGTYYPGAENRSLPQVEMRDVETVDCLGFLAKEILPNYPVHLN